MSLASSDTNDSPAPKDLEDEVEAAEDARAREEADPKNHVAKDLAVAEEASAA